MSPSDEQSRRNGMQTRSRSGSGGSGPRASRDRAYDVRMANPGSDHEFVSRQRPVRAPEPVHPLDDDHDRHDGALRSVGRIFAALVGLAVLAALAFGGMTLLGGDRGGSDVSKGEKVRVVIPRGADGSKVADVLADAGVISSPLRFRAKLRLEGDGAAFRSGTYTMVTGSGYDQIVKILEKGPPAAKTFGIALPEGFRATEIAQRVDGLRKETGEGAGPTVPAFTGRAYLAATSKVKLPRAYAAPAGTVTLEGFLFPATYTLRTTATPEDLVRKQLDAFAENLAQVDMRRARAAGFSTYEIVTIASMIEREAVLDRERPLIAAVMWNRLEVGEPLGIDATTQYHADPLVWKTELTQSDLEADSQYNTRRNAGLPPTPIASPGLKSLRAAANPARVNHRYYVANPNGNGAHFFTDSYDEFLSHPFQQ